MHERSPKNEPIDTVLYEIGMLRYCAQTVAEKKARAEEIGSDAARAEYNLGIEGFLLHLRNVLAFLTNRVEKPSDLGINDPRQWANRPVQAREYSDLLKAAKRVDKAHGVNGSTCYDQISKFLQHCTTLRYERAKSWDIEEIFADVNPLLERFLDRFATAPRTSGGLIVGSDNSTVSPTAFHFLSPWGPDPSRGA